MVHWKSALSNWLLVFGVYLADTKTCGSPLWLRLLAPLRLPAGKHAGILTYLQRKVKPGGLVIDRDFAQDFIALQHQGRTEAAWLVGEAFEGSRSSV